MRKYTKIALPLISLFCLLTLAISPSAIGLAQYDATTHPGPKIMTLLDPEPRPRYEPPPAVFLLRPSNTEQAATANIVVNYNGPGWTTEAQTAFEYAADIWESLITSQVPIIVDAQFKPLGSGVLGGAGPTSIERDFTNAPQANTWYPAATANQLANTDLTPGFSDIEASFSSSYQDWHFGTGSSTPVDKISFVSVVLHELGHGLGFLGSMQVDDGIGKKECNGTAGWGCYGVLGYPMIYDRFTENGSGTALLSFSNNSASLGSQLTSNNLFFDSSMGNIANEGNRVPIYSPSSWRQGSSYSHLAESFNTTPHALMTFSISKGETIHNPGSVTLCMFSEMGWTITETCEPTPINGLTVANDGPTILGNATQLTASISSGSNVSYEWDFGDGNHADGAAVAHQYASPGTYTAEVTATNSVSSDTATTTVLVEQAISGLSALNDGPTLIGDSTQLTATISNGSNVSYEWDFGDGNSGFGADITHLYAAPGIYTAEVTAMNALGQETATTKVKVLEITDRVFMPILVNH
jgi:PKD repeat protein